MRKATKQDIGRMATIVSTDELNGTEVLITDVTTERAFIEFPNGAETVISFNKLEIED